MTACCKRRNPVFPSPSLTHCVPPSCSVRLLPLLLTSCELCDFCHIVPISCPAVAESDGKGQFVAPHCLACASAAPVAGQYTAPVLVASDNVNQSVVVVAVDAGPFPSPRFTQVNLPFALPCGRTFFVDALREALHLHVQGLLCVHDQGKPCHSITLPYYWCHGRLRTARCSLDWFHALAQREARRDTISSQCWPAQSRASGVTGAWYCLIHCSHLFHIFSQSALPTSAPYAEAG